MNFAIKRNFSRKDAYGNNNLHQRCVLEVKKYAQCKQNFFKCLVSSKLEKVSSGWKGQVYYGTSSAKSQKIIIELEVRTICFLF